MWIRGMCWVWAARGHLPGSAAVFALTESCFAFTGSCRLLLHLCALQLPEPLAGEMKARGRPCAVRALQHLGFTEPIPTPGLCEQLGGCKADVKGSSSPHLPGDPGQVRWEAGDGLTLSTGRSAGRQSPQPLITPAVALELTAEGSPWWLLQSIPVRAVPPVFAFPKSPSPGRVSMVTPSDPMRALRSVPVPVLSPCRALQQFWLCTPEAAVVPH